MHVTQSRWTSDEHRITVKLSLSTLITQTLTVNIETF